MKPDRTRIDKLNERIRGLIRERDSALLDKAKQDGFIPCSDCVDGFCSMNCSSAPTYLQVLV